MLNIFITIFILLIFICILKYIYCKNIFCNSNTNSDINVTT